MKSGDYFDFLGVGIALRIPSAWCWRRDGPRCGRGALMTTARAFLRMRASRCGGSSEIVTEMNRQPRPGCDRQRPFMTLSSYASTGMRALNWVRAAIRPPWSMIPPPTVFRELRGQGPPLGVDEHYRYEEYLDATSPPARS